MLHRLLYTCFCRIRDPCRLQSGSQSTVRGLDWIMNSRPLIWYRYLSCCCSSSCLGDVFKKALSPNAITSIVQQWVGLCDRNGSNHPHYTSSTPIRYDTSNPTQEIQLKIQKSSWLRYSTDDRPVVISGIYIRVVHSMGWVDPLVGYGCVQVQSSQVVASSW